MYKLLLLISVLLSGCATYWPESGRLNPQVTTTTQSRYTGQQITIEGVDKRPAPHIFSIQERNTTPVLINSEQPLNQLLVERLSNGLRAQGANVSNSGSANLTLFISNALVTVEEQRFSYITRAQVSLEAIAEFQGSRQAKRFNITSNSEGSRKPNMATLEATLTNQLSRALQQIIDDESLSAVLTGQPQ